MPGIGLRSMALSGCRRSISFFVATAFLVAAYATLLEKHPPAAFILAFVGAWLTFWFNRLETRSCQLVQTGEQALKASQAHLAQLAQSPDLRILDAVERPASRFASYSDAIKAIQWTVFALAGSSSPALSATGSPARSTTADRDGRAVMPRRNAGPCAAAAIGTIRLRSRRHTDRRLRRHAGRCCAVLVAGPWANLESSRCPTRLRACFPAR
jgi:hypothetical protein